MLYMAYIQSHFNYCTGYWWKNGLQKLFRIQKRAIRIISTTNDPVKKMEDLEILPLPLAITYNLCTFLHDQIMFRRPKVLDICMLGSGRTTRAEKTRLIKLERKNRRVGRDSLGVRAARIWNCLPMVIRTTDSRSLFKKRLKNHLLKSTNARLNYF